MTTAKTNALEVSGYALQRILTDDDPPRTLLCIDERGKPVVMKRLDVDCLHRDQLHPAIRDRLARVREMPHARLAILRGVERFGGAAYMIWNFVTGTAWEDAEITVERWPDRARELVLAVDLLHVQGIVHGSLHGRNIIVDESGDIWITDVSPYLYTDATVDIETVRTFLLHSIPVGDELSAARSALDRFDPTSDALRDLANALMAGAAAPSLTSIVQDQRGRWRSLAATLVLMASCAVIAYFVYGHLS